MDVLEHEGFLEVILSPPNEAVGLERTTSGGSPQAIRRAPVIRRHHLISAPAPCSRVSPRGRSVERGCTGLFWRASRSPTSSG
jgi:hypothetical protein